jgi:Xaa-Pro aminopeptidase
MDFARSTVVGGEPTGAQRRVLEGTIGVVKEVVEGIRPGVPIAALCERGVAWLRENGFRPEEGLQQFAPLFGHGLGLALERPWIIADEPMLIQPNMTLAVEALLADGDIGANFEHNVLVTEDGCEILDAKSSDVWWS